MLKDKNVEGQILQVIDGSNPRRATNWCDQPTAPPILEVPIWTMLY